jgi:hypothetical protein
MTRSVGVQNAGHQPFANQSQKGPVVDAQTQHRQQPHVVEIIEETFDIGLYNVAIDAVLQVKGQLSHRIQCSTPRPVAVAAIQEVLLIDG